LGEDYRRGKTVGRRKGYGWELGTVPEQEGNLRGPQKKRGDFRRFW